EMPVELLADCVGLAVDDVITTAHRPVSASVGNSFVIAEVKGDALTRATPDIGRFRVAAQSYTALRPNPLPLYLGVAAQSYTALGPNRLPLYLYDYDGARIRTRMFSPLAGTIEDAATAVAA